MRMWLAHNLWTERWHSIDSEPASLTPKFMPFSPRLQTGGSPARSGPPTSFTNVLLILCSPALIQLFNTWEISLKIWIFNFSPKKVALGLYLHIINRSRWFPACLPPSPPHPTASLTHTKPSISCHLASHMPAVFSIVEKYFSIKSSRTKMKPRDLHLSRWKSMHKSTLTSFICKENISTSSLPPTWSTGFYSLPGPGCRVWNSHLNHHPVSTSVCFVHCYVPSTWNCPAKNGCVIKNEDVGAARWLS